MNRNIKSYIQHEKRSRECTAHQKYTSRALLSDQLWTARAQSVTILLDFWPIFRKKVVGKTEHPLKKLKELVKSLSTLVIEEEKILNSHNVVSLFTNTPIDKALEVIQERLEKNQQ